MTIWKLGVGLGAVLLLAASVQGADPASRDSDRRGSDDVAQAPRQRGSFGYRNFEGRFGDVDRPRARPGDATKKDGAEKDGARPKPEARHRDGGEHRSAKPGDGASSKKEGHRGADSHKHRKPELARDGRPDWHARWRPSTAGFQGRGFQGREFYSRGPGQGHHGQFAGRHGGSGFGGQFASASWRGPQRHAGHGQMGRHGYAHMGAHGRCAFASMHGGRHKQGAMGRYAHQRHRGHGQMGRHGQGRQMAHGRHGGHHGRYAGASGKRGGCGHHGHDAHRGHGGWQHRAVAMRGQHGQWGRNMAMGRMAAMQWHHRGFAPSQFGRQGHGQPGFAMNPWMMRSQWQGFGPGQTARGPQGGTAINRANTYLREQQQRDGGSRPQQFNRPWEAPVRPAGMPGRGPQARGAGQGDARVAELSTRLDRLQRELERLRREVR